MGGKNGLVCLIHIYLNGLKTLYKDTAKQIATFRGYYLYLNGLETLDKETAIEIATFKGSTLSLNGLKTLDKETAKQLATFEGKYAQLHLNGWHWCIKNFIAQNQYFCPPF